MHQDLRSFVRAFEDEYPQEVVRVSEPVNLEYQPMALVLEYEKRRRAPILFFENVPGHKIPIISNVLAGRRQLAKALGVDEAGLTEDYSRRLKNYIDPVVIGDPPFRQVLLTGQEADLGILPIPTYFPGDGGPYLTAGMVVAKHPDTGVVTEGFHRLQVKGPRKMGCSLHSRRRMFEYQRAYEARGQDMDAAICLGLHPIIAMGSLSYPPPEVSKFEVCGGLFEEPTQLARCSTIDLDVPAWSEIVIEGKFLSGVREPEGPFGEFIGYFSGRSTDHVFMVKAISMREDAWFQSIASGRSADHVTALGAVREVEVLNALRKTIPGVKQVNIPTSGCSGFVGFISIHQSRPGEANHAIAIALGVDHYLKLVVVVDDDVDVYDESDVLWAIATRAQADRDMVVIGDSLGTVLDPSANDEGVTSKLGIDATKPVGQPYPEKLAMDAEYMDWARRLVDGLA